MRKRMMRTDKNVRLCRKKFIKDQSVFMEQLCQHLFIGRRKIEDADFTFETADIFDDFISLRFTEGEVIPVFTKFADQVGKWIPAGVSVGMTAAEFQAAAAVEAEASSPAASPSEPQPPAEEAPAEEPPASSPQA